MMKTLSVLPVLLAAGLLSAPEVHALTSDNGRNINGRNLNGTALYGAADEAVAARAVSVVLKDGEHIVLR